MIFCAAADYDCYERSFSMKLFRGKCGEINALATRRIAGEQQSISQNAPHKRNQRLALEPIWFWLAGSLPNVPDQLPRAAAMADLQSSGSLPPLRRSKSRRTAWGVGAIRSALRCSKPIAKPVIIPSSKSICRILAPTSAPRPSSAPLLFCLPLHRRRRRIFALQPIRGPAGTEAAAGLPQN